jgi:PAS domain S-box-containing protein
MWRSDVESPFAAPADEAARLRRCLSDLVSIMALPALWTGKESRQIVSTLADALLGLLPLTFVFVRWNEADGGSSFDLTRVAGPMEPTTPFREAGAMLNTALGDVWLKWPARARVTMGDADVSLASVQLGVDGEFGVVVVGSERLVFPDQTEQVLLEAAANQTCLGLQQARLMTEQRRVARELDERVAERTSQLEVANEQLKKSEEDSRLIVDNIPGLICLLSGTGEVEVVNRQLLDYFGRTLEHLKQWKTIDTVHPEDLPNHIAVVSRATAIGNAFETEQRFKRSDGVYRWFQSRCCPLRDANGTVYRWCVLLNDIDDRKRAEEALRESEHESRLIVDNIPGLVALLSATGEVEFVNRQSLDYFGQTLAELKQWGTNDTVHPEDLPNVIDVFSRSIAAGSSYEIVQRFKRSDGVYRWFQNRGFPVRDANGTVNRWCVLLTDIDDRMRAEEAVRESEHESRLIVDSIPGLVTVVTASGEMESVNRQVTEYVGRSLEELKQWRTNDSVHPEDLPGMSHAFAQYLASGEPGDFEARLRRFDGAYRWFQLRSLPLRDREGRIVRWYVLQTDIEDRKRAEDELRRKENFLSTAQRLSLSGSFSWRLETNEVTFSEEAYRIYEFERDSPVTLEQIGRRVHPDDRHLLQERVTAARTIGDVHDYQIRLLMPDRSVKYLHTTSSEIQDANGGRQYIGAVQDVTQRRLAEEALNTARSELAHVARVATVSALTASIAHEVNQPLSGIITNAGTCLRMLAADPPDVDGARETVRRTIRDGNRASDVITRLRALFSKKEFTLESLDLNDATREVIALSLSDLQRQRVVLQSEFAEALPKVTGDRVQLQQVILNLLRNASDAMTDVQERPRHLLIRTDREDDGGVRLSVRDTGVGLGGQNLDKLFDSFYTTKSGGMGIGLSVSRAIIERHRGRLWAEHNDGPGATFAFSIPGSPMIE